MNNIIIFGYNSNMYRRSYADIIDLQNIQYLPSFLDEKRDFNCLLTKANKIIYYAWKIHNSKKINNIIKIPLKCIWFNHYIPKKFKKNSEIIFLFFGRQLSLLEYGYVDYLKKQYPNSKFACFFQDLIKTHENIDIIKVKESFDLVISFDQKDSQEYEIAYFPLVNSVAKIDLTSNFDYSDIYFLGYAKDRLQDIISAFEALSALNLKCNFFVVDAKSDEIKYADKINYITGMSYDDNLKHISKTKCLLELMQKEGRGYTQRMMEAIMYDKLIITNNPTVNSAPFYNSSNILQFSDIKKITSNQFFFNNFERSVDHQYKRNISPVKLLEFITINLNESKS